jgi:hypothetical protein
MRYGYHTPPEQGPGKGKDTRIGELNDNQGIQ